MEISIKKPCHEKWDEMTPNEQGAFCGKCMKTVVDFSNKTIEEIKAYFTGKQNEKVCGRFETQQLTSLSFDTFFSEFKGFNFTKRFAVILYFTFGMWLFNASSGMAQIQEPIKGDVKVDQNVMGGVRVNPTPKDTIKKYGNPVRKFKTVKGKVKIVDSKPIENKMKTGEVFAEPLKKEPTKPKQK